MTETTYHSPNDEVEHYKIPEFGSDGFFAFSGIAWVSSAWLTQHPSVNVKVEPKPNKFSNLAKTNAIKTVAFQSK